MFNSVETRDSLQRIRHGLLKLANRSHRLASLCDTNSILPVITEERLKVQLEELATIEFSMMDLLIAISDLERSTGLTVSPAPPPPIAMSREREARVMAALSLPVQVPQAAGEFPYAPAKPPTPAPMPPKPRGVPFRKTTKPTRARAGSAV